MTALAFFLAPLLFAILVDASPYQLRSHLPRINLLGELVLTPIGIARGTSPINGISQFAVKYATTQRWQNPVVMNIWELPYAPST